jgi:dimethylhistidine N-methyltransferase
MRPSAAFAPEILASQSAAFAADARDGLTASPKTLPARWLYDAIGSALFEAICLLPWYPITRAETAMIDRTAPEIARALPSVTEVVELGPGSGEKLARLLTPFARRAMNVIAHLVDVSPDALDAAERTLERLARVRVVRHHAAFEAGLQQAISAPRSGGRLVAFLGSNIGNFDPDPADALMASIAAALAPGDGLLLGADLVKPERVLLDAYDDPLGVTAAFNRNLLARMNRELGADFELRRFDHRAGWNAEAGRVEMHLVSAVAQQVHVPGAGLVASFSEGETIWTESSYKYEPQGLAAMGTRAGLHLANQWIDGDARFALTLFVR